MYVVCTVGVPGGVQSCTLLREHCERAATAVILQHGYETTRQYRHHHGVYNNKRKVSTTVSSPGAVAVGYGVGGTDGDGYRMLPGYSIFKDFGSGIASDKFGILFQNRGAGFTLEEGHPNELKGGKRPMHTIIPAMLRRNGKVFMPFGVMGGAYQPNGHARVVTNMVDYGMDPQAAIDAPRAFSDAGNIYSFQ